MIFIETNKLIQNSIKVLCIDNDDGPSFGYLYHSSSTINYTLYTENVYTNMQFSNVNHRN